VVKTLSLALLVTLTVWTQVSGQQIESAPIGPGEESPPTRLPPVPPEWAMPPMITAPPTEEPPPPTRLPPLPPLLPLVPLDSPEPPRIDRLEPLGLEEDPLPPMKIWSGSFQLGLDGASGNNEAFNLHLGLNAQRRTPLNCVTIQMDYFKKTSDGVETANRGYADTRLERFFLGSPWTVFIHGTFEYDQFAGFDRRLSMDAGVGRKLIESDDTFFIARFGLGATRSFGSPDDEVTPEAVLGLDYQRKIGKRHLLTVSGEYIPDLMNFGQYRINSHADWTFLLDDELKLSLKFEVLDRYDSQSFGKKPNDIDYAAMILWKF
jgi:hypothetical protein